MLIEGTPDVLFAPKTPGAFGGLGLSISDLPANWSSYSPAQKIAYFNENLIIPSELLTAGVSQSDIDWMIDNGYDVQQIELELASNARLRADFEAAEAARIAAERAAAEASARAAAEAAARAAAEANRPVMVGNVVLPTDWSRYTPAQKIKFFNDNLITPEQLLQAGVTQSDIDWMSSNGYVIKTAAAEAAARAAAEAAARAAAEAAARAAAEAAARAADEANRPVMVGNVVLPTDWSRYTPAQKIEFFNDNLITPEQLLQAGVSQSDIDWMVANGYKTQSESKVMETNVFTEPVTIGNVALPSNWSTYTAAQKIAFFNKNSITEIMLLDAGVDVNDITWMKANGYTGKPAASIKLTQTTTQTNAALPLIIAAAAAYLIGG